MKKGIIAIIAAIYAIAIIVVAFLGAKADIAYETVYVKEILLDNASVYYPGQKETEDNLVVEVVTRPLESDINESGRGSDGTIWNVYEGDEIVTKRDYAIYIRDYGWFYDKWNGTLELNLTINPENATRKDLDYYCTNPLLLRVEGKGSLVFEEKFKRPVSGDLVVSSTDQSNVSIDILITANRYE